MDTFANDALVQAVTAHAMDFMRNYDASHGWDHIERVVGLSRYIYSQSANRASLDLRVIQLAALLHDVADRKYLLPTDDPTSMIATVLTTHGAPADLAAKVQTICHGVSYSSEIKDPARVAALVAAHPELAVVQDADRLDAIGAVGVARMFTFGGAKTGRDLAGSMEHLDEKLLRLEGMAKTDVGRALARERTERLRVFRQWFVDEVAFSVRAAEPEGAE
ncbi:hypothetical protein B0T22DRAFT_202616 [Podospora appendiculata]|uniref:HD/PDEase domain-containing protein n=1 Tax=Podospora appendiculata TaxID=314037 RepID=A0AAE0X4A9_9PEZI|nr:hypothetical protein B0T22DRAFT_202616 [Podospora appendiculata]